MISHRSERVFLVAAAALAAAITPFAAPSPLQQSNPVIEGARVAAATFAQSLPDYIVKRTTTRYLGTRNRATDPAEYVHSWRTLDTVSGDVAAVHGKEVYSNITVNGKPREKLPAGGAWSTGEFSNNLLAVLAPEKAARFTHQHK